MFNLLYFVFLFITSFFYVYARWKIVNGSTAVHHEYPQMVSIKLFGIHICGGTLLNGNTVLTAAHCLWDYKKYSPKMLKFYEFQVVLGEHDLHQVYGDEKVFQINEVKVHPLYISHDSYEFGYDIGLVKFDGFVSNTEVPYIKYAEYARTDTLGPGDRCDVVGWGSLDAHGGVGARMLQKAVLNIISAEECSEEFVNVKNTPTNFCAGSGFMSTSACKGDSGGPLFCKNSFGENIQMGIVSYGRVPCRFHVPTVFTKISEFVPWIMKYTNK